MVQTPAVHESGPTKQVGITGRDMQQMQFRQLRLARLASVPPWLFLWILSYGYNTLLAV